MAIEFAAPPPPPPPPPQVEPEPEPAEEAKPVVEDAPPPPKPKVVPKPVPKPKPKPQPKPVPQPPQPPQPAPPPTAPTPPAPPRETQPLASAAGLHNPPPRYPAQAQKRGQEGTAVLRIRVLANGRAGEVQIQRSSGHKSLDDAAVEAVRGWSFVPAKRGDTAIDGWVAVPLTFKLN
nr:energy transducer TonB [Pseudomonas putida]